MEFISDEDITAHLDKYGIPHGSTPYTRIQNNNNAITDNQHFFIKLSTSFDSLHLELATSLILPFAPQALIPEIVYIKDTPTITMQHIHHSPITAETVSQLSEKQLESIAIQMSMIHTLTPAVYKTYRKLEAIQNLIQQRLKHPSLTDYQVKQMEEINNQFIRPYVHKYANYPTLAHTDVKLDNILNSNNTVMLIDYESVKPSPKEIDLASLYQDLYQTGYEKEYHLIAHHVNQIENIDPDVLQENILFKNAVTTTAAVRLDDKTVLNQRLEILLDVQGKKEAPSRLPKVELNKNL